MVERLRRARERTKQYASMIIRVLAVGAVLAGIGVPQLVEWNSEALAAAYGAWGGWFGAMLWLDAREIDRIRHRPDVRIEVTDETGTGVGQEVARQMASQIQSNERYDA